MAYSPLSIASVIALLNACANGLITGAFFSSLVQLCVCAQQCVLVTVVCVCVSSKSKTALQFHFKCSALCSVAAVSECVVLCAPIDGYRLHGNCALTSRLPSLLLLPLLLPARPFVCDAFVRSALDD